MATIRDETFDAAHRWAHHRAGPDDRAADPQAERRVEWKIRLADELLRYVLVTAVLVLLVRPIGVLVGLIWGLGIVRRLYHGEVAPKLRRRWMREAFRTPPAEAPRRPCGRGRRSACFADAPRERPEQRLAREMGDDPGGREPVGWAREALHELERAQRGGPATVPLADLVEDALDALEPVAERHGIAFRLETDAEGQVEGDADRLAAALRDLLGDSLQALRRGAHGDPEIRVAMGEDLAGAEAWVRIRDPRTELLEGAEGTRGVYGSRPVPGVPGATLETRGRPGHGVERILTVPKRSAARRPGRPEDAA